MVHSAPHMTELERHVEFSRSVAVRGPLTFTSLSEALCTTLLHVTVPASFSTFLINVAFLLFSLSDPAALNVLNVS